MLNITSIHAFFAFWTLISGFFVYAQRELLWSKGQIWLYLIPHLITAITGLFLRSSFQPISPFKVLSVITIIAFCISIFRIYQNNYIKARKNMLGAFVGLCIAFVGTLYPERLFGGILFEKVSFDIALWIWIGLMIVTSVGGILFAIFHQKKLN